MWWEYCELRAKLPTRQAVELWDYPMKGLLSRESGRHIKFDITGLKGVPQIIARLGEEGWELVAATTDQKLEHWYFKRLKED